MKVSHHKKFHPTEGTVYNQVVSMKLTELIHLRLAIEREISLGYPRAKEYNNGVDLNPKLYLTKLSPKDNNLVYLNLTQRRFMELFLLKEVRKRVLDKNTCILIK